MKPLRMMVSTILVISCLLCLPKSGSINASIFDVGPINFDGSFNIQKGIDTNRDGIYNDGDKTVRAGGYCFIQNKLGIQSGKRSSC